MDGASWDYWRLDGAVRPAELMALKLNAVLVDLSLFEADPWAFLQCLRELMPGLAILVCSQNSTVAQRVRGLRLGADDWISKPAHPEEVMARIEAVVRRRLRIANPVADFGPAVFGELEVRGEQFQAFVDGQGLGLTRREFELLQALIDADQLVIERDELYRRVWGYEMAHGDRSVDVFVRKLRAKLSSASPDWNYIHTHFGVGYRFAACPAGADDDPVAPAATNPSRVLTSVRKTDRPDGKVARDRATWGSSAPIRVRETHK